MGVFDDILKTVSPEHKAVLDQHPEIGQAMGELEVALAKSSEFVTNWETWRAGNWDPDKKMTKTEVAAREELARVQTELAEKAGAAGVEMTFDETIAALKKAGFAPRAEIVEELKSQFVAPQAQTEALNRLALGFQNAFVGTYTLGLEHQQEFGKLLNIGELFEYMNKNNLNDPRDAYSRMVAPLRAEKAAADSAALAAKHQEELKQAEERGAIKARQETAMGSGGLPTDQDGSNAGMGHLQASRQAPPKDDDVAKVLKETELGAGSLAQKGFEEWQQKQSTVQ